MKEVVLFFPKPWPGTEMAGRIPYSLLHLHSYLKNENFKIRIIDERVFPDIQELINKFNNNILCFGISSFTGVQIQNGLRITKQLKEKFPDIPIVWGGWHPSCLPEQTLKHKLVDIVVRGQGEETFKELLYSLLNCRPLSEVKGISYKNGETILHNPDRELLPLIESLKLEYNVIDVEKYIYKSSFADKVLGIITSLGCPFKCGFCAIGTIYKGKTIFRNIDTILEEIDYLVDRHKINAITIDDDNFFVSINRVKEFCEKLINKHYRISWDAGAHVGLLLKHYNNDTLKLIKESGCKQLYIGAESGSDEVLNIINKKANVAQTYEFVRKMKEIGIKPFLSTMVCFPGVSSEDIYLTLNMICKCTEIDPDLGFRLFYYTPYPGTPLYKKAAESGMIVPKTLEEWAGHTLRKFNAPWIKPSHRKLVKLFYTFYYISSNKPKININVIKYIIKIILFNIAKWRIKKRYFNFPIDAYIVIKKIALQNWFWHVFYKKSTISLFDDYE